ncbi:DUF2892 domain-containing protein [Hymenobacter humi]|uniref:DUF2892 domain-containing protein n=1 Tax=Hymenobacter humi TaxID=1411620 RepID=A0ABW2UGE8_9BACT
MDKLLRFLASPAGRLTRVAVGSSLIATGLAQDRKNWVLATVGLVPLTMGAFDWCLLAPSWACPSTGPACARFWGRGPPPAFRVRCRTLYEAEAEVKDELRLYIRLLINRIYSKQLNRQTRCY